MPGPQTCLQWADSMRAILDKLGNALLDLALPPRCHLCRCSIPQAGPIHLCQDCRNNLTEVVSPCCTICGRPFTGAVADHPCGACLQQHPPWEHARAAFSYEGGCQELIQAFKYRNRFHLRRSLALLTAERLATFAANCRADLLIPVPLHPRRLRMRGFNQALLLAEVLADSWQLPLLRQGLRRSRNTTSQTRLSATERAANLRGAFSVPDPAAILGKRIVLVDDVFTTGSTLAECSRCLLKAKAASVCCVTVARAPDPAA